MPEDKSQDRVNQLFEAVVEALKKLDATDEEAAIACSSAVGFYLAVMDETAEERISAAQCMLHIALDTMRLTLKQEQEA